MTTPEIQRFLDNGYQLTVDVDPRRPRRSATLATVVLAKDERTRHSALGSDAVEALVNLNAHLHGEKPHRREACGAKAKGHREGACTLAWGHGGGCWFPNMWNDM